MTDIRRLEKVGLGMESSSGEAVITSSLQVEANRCGCFLPELHAEDTLHKACYDLGVASREFWTAILDSLPGFIRRFFS